MLEFKTTEHNRCLDAEKSLALCVTVSLYLVQYNVRFLNSCRVNGWRMTGDKSEGKKPATQKKMTTKTRAIVMKLY